MCLLIPDAGPLISLGRGDALHILLKLRLPIYIVDQVRFEVTQDSRFPDALAVQRFITENSETVSVFPTLVGRMAHEAREAGFKGRQRGLGEAAVAEFLARLDEVIDTGTDAALLLYEDSDINSRHFSLPKNVHLISNRALLEGMESRGLIPSAEDIWRRMEAGGRSPSKDLTDQPGTVAGKPTSW